MAVTKFARARHRCELGQWASGKAATLEPLTLALLAADYLVESCDDGEPLVTQIEEIRDDPTNNKHLLDAMAFVARERDEPEKILYRASLQLAMVIWMTSRDQPSEAVLLRAAEPVLARFAKDHPELDKTHLSDESKRLLRSVRGTVSYEGNGQLCSYLLRCIRSRADSCIEGFDVECLADEPPPEASDAALGEAAAPAVSPWHWLSYAMLQAYLHGKVKDCAVHGPTRRVGMCVANFVYQLEAGTPPLRNATRGDLRLPNVIRGGRAGYQRKVLETIGVLATSPEEVPLRYRPFIGQEAAKAGLECARHGDCRDPNTLYTKASGLADRICLAADKAYSWLLERSLGEVIALAGRPREEARVFHVCALTQFLDNRELQFDTLDAMPGALRLPPGVTPDDIRKALTGLRDQNVTDAASFARWKTAFCDQLNTLCAERAAREPLLSDAVAAPPPLAAV
ncbi:MAG: hypothetical protein HUU35_05710 [Armatimonadetes bacterium]|nr:hypothetical protein [Armatimonadota bacterium]